MQRVCVAALTAACISGVSVSAWAGPVQLGQHMANAEWRCLAVVHTQPLSATTHFQFDEATLVALMLDGAPFERDATELAWDARGASIRILTPGDVSLCWLMNDLRPEFSALNTAQFTMSPALAARGVMARTSVRGVAPSFAPGFVGPVKNELLAWSNEDWATSDSHPNEQHLPLSLDYSTVAVPNPFMLGAVGLIALIVARQRRMARLQRAR